MGVTRGTIPAAWRVHKSARRIPLAGRSTFDLEKVDDLGRRLRKNESGSGNGVSYGLSIEVLGEREVRRDYVRQWDKVVNSNIKVGGMYVGPGGTYEGVEEVAGDSGYRKDGDTLIWNGPRLYEQERRRLVGVYERARDVLEGVYDRLLCPLNLEWAVREDGGEDDDDGGMERLRRLRLHISDLWMVVTIGGTG
ncbi:hypothetical protein BDM02DRAFT_3132706 [Thelephora ganbajun]|uniref:Uncharacterized protein n=1 Tax=Thelephora ganbajun TaxID=370292 RepID=A0ACB6Z0J0_THEGA|nr:hypothetical protein BDM02DRAFT_3132706 [Thelephora ganbajun]